MTKYRLGIIDESEKDRTKSIAFFDDYFECVELSLDVESEDELINQVIENQLDAVAIDYKLVDHPNLDFNGNIVLKKLMDERYNFPAFILTNLVPDASEEYIDDFRIISKRAINPESIEGKELIQKLNNNISKYYKDIENKEDELFALIQKEQSEELSDQERDRLIELDDFLEHSFCQKSKIPKGWKNPKGYEEIERFAMLAEEILKEIKEKK